MQKLILLFILIAPLSHAQEVLDPTLTTPVPVTTSQSDLDRDRDFNPRRSHWVLSLGAEVLQYEVPVEFKGEREEFKKSDGRKTFYGGRLGIGYELYIGGGLNTTTKIEGFYSGTLFNSRQTADPDVEDIDFAYTKETGSLFGGEAAQSLGYIFDFSTKTLFGNKTMLYLEPYVEAGIGVAQAYNRLDYNYDTGASGVQESYKTTIRDNLVSGRLSVGMNVISSEGYFLHLKASQTIYNVLKREIDEEARPNMSPAPIRNDRTDKDAKIDPVYSFVLGGGYKF